MVPMGRGLNELCPLPGCRVEAITPDGPNLLHIAARGIRPGGRCPDCGRASRVVHSRYRRQPADLAWRLPELVAPHARRTARLAEARSQVGVVLGGGASAKLLQRLARPMSADTMLHLVPRLPRPGLDALRCVAVDGWALRKGRTYSTVVLDGAGRWLA